MFHLRVFTDLAYVPIANVIWIDFSDWLSAAGTAGLNGYKVVFVPFANGQPNGIAEDVVTEFLNSEGRAHGRPGALALDKAGALLIAGDAGNSVWRVTAASQKQAARTD